MKELIGGKKLIKEKKFKSYYLMILIFFLLTGLTFECLLAQISHDEDDLKTIRQAVAKEKIYGQPTKSSPRWLKIWIKDEAKKNEEVKISLPVALVDFLVLKAEARKADEGCSIMIKDDFSFIQDKKWMKSRLKLSDIWLELKRLGPGYLMELKGDSAFVRIWLE